MPSPFVQAMERKIREFRESPAATVMRDKIKDIAYRVGIKKNSPVPSNQREFNQNMESFGKQLSRPADRLLKKYKEVTGK